MDKVICPSCGRRAVPVSNAPGRVACYDCGMFVENCKCKSNPKLEKFGVVT